jgi:hypothetical protein
MIVEMMMIIIIIIIIIIITFLIDIALSNTHNLAKSITDKQNKYQELANEICAMWKQNTAQAIPLSRNIGYGCNPKVTIVKSKKTSPASQYVHTNAKICNS